LGTLRWSALRDRTLIIERWADIDGVRLAARNNAGWCAAVCAEHGSAGEWSELAWTHEAETPRYYPNVVTLDARSLGLLAMLDRMHAKRPLGAWSLKDSFAAFDELRTRGWRVLFSAHWLVLPAPSVVDPKGDARAWRVHDTAALASWELGWRRAAGDAEGERTFLPGLLGDEQVAVIALGLEGEQITAGAIAYRGAGVVGLSNLFGPREQRENQCATAVRAAGHIFPGLPIVSYARGEQLQLALDAGFSSLGPLRVWTKGAQ
jgi:hypothetical protein